MMYDDIIQRLGWTLVHTVWQAAAIAIVLSMLLMLARRLSSNARYLLSCAALLAVVGAAVVTFARMGLSSHSPRANVRHVTQIVPALAESSAKPQAAEPFLPGANAVDIERAVPWLVGIWGAGVIGISIWQLGGWVLLQRFRRSVRAVDLEWQKRLETLRKRMTVRDVVLRLSDRIDVPIVIGALRPMILAPISMFSEMSVQQVEMILAHELAHVRRHDYLVNLVQAVIETLLFYHPAVWWISRQIRHEREHCCDEAAVQVCGDRAGYARALAMLEQSRAATILAPAATGGGGRSELLMRVRRLVGQPAAANGRMRSCAAAVLLLVIAAAFPLSSRWLHAQESAATQQVSKDANPFAGNPKPSPIMPEDFIADSKAYTIAPGDVLQVSIGDPVAPNLQSQKTTRVSKDGLISLPLIGSVKVAGSTQAEAEKAIAQVYADRNLIKDAKVNVVVLEARGRTFSIFGSVKQAGQYALVKGDVRLFDALMLAGGAAKGADLRIIRGDRLIEIPAEPITAADPRVNILIRSRDVIIASGDKLRAFRVIVEPTHIVVSGQPTDWNGVRQMLQAPPETDRSRARIYIELAAGSGDLAVRQFFDAQAQASKIVQELRLSHVSEVGIEVNPPPAQARTYFVGGQVARVGLYALSERKISLAQAAAAAGVHDGANFVTLIRRTGGKEEYVLANALLDEIYNRVRADVMIEPGDQITIDVKPNPATQAVESPRL